MRYGFSFFIIRLGIVQHNDPEHPALSNRVQCRSHIAHFTSGRDYSGHGVRYNADSAVMRLPNEYAV
jgi:hypothetical protein